MNSLLLLLLFLQQPLAEDSLVAKQYFHPNGKVSSEGYLKDGKPEGYWKSYDNQGALVSEGNRQNYLLDGSWKFYKNGKLSSTISYKSGEKQGKSTYYHSTEIIEEYYENNILEGVKKIYDTSYTRLLKWTPYHKGMEHGLEKEYNSLGILSFITLYKNGFIVYRERINKIDKNGFKQGVWKEFHPNDVLFWEVNYLNNQKHGYYKEYDTSSNIVKIEKYQYGELQEEAPELEPIEMKEEYYANGNLKISVPYKNGKPEGICRYFDSITGKVIKGVLFKNGEIVGGGIIDEYGYFQDEWIEYYPDGKVKSKGKFRRGKKHGVWKYYYANGQIEQEGSYKNGGLEGGWVWYFEDGRPRLEQEYLNGKLDGPNTEYDEKGRIVAKGEYVEGEEQGKWLYLQGREKIEGTYQNGQKRGIWKYYWDENSKKLSFSGNYIDDLPHGKHVQYYENGRPKLESYFMMGKQTGTWKKYNEDGELEVKITYNKDEEEERYDWVRTGPKE